MKLPVIQMLCIAALSGAIGAAYADEGKDESGIRIVLPDINRLPEIVAMFLPVPG